MLLEPPTQLFLGSDHLFEALIFKHFIIIIIIIIIIIVIIIIIIIYYCWRQEEPAILISRLLLRMSRMYSVLYVASIRLDFH